ncbi:MAG: hypothetical protein ABJB09_01830 [Verrucomicrobiota bacterium]
MSMENLSSYLNDHLAGSVAALELLNGLIETYNGQPLGQFFQGLRHEIAEDKGVLQKLIDDLGEQESVARKAAAWLGERLSRAKIRLSGDGEDDAGLLQALEALFLGVTGKQSLWRALGVACATNPHLRRLNYAELEERAVEQCERIEAKRLQVARTVFRSE